VPDPPERNSAFRGFSGTGAYKFLSDNVIEVKCSQDLNYFRHPIEVYCSPAELALVELRDVAFGQDPASLTGYPLIQVFRREGKEGALAEGEGLGGSADNLRRQLAGNKWLDGDLSWEFTADGTFKRLFQPPGSFRVLDGRTLEVSANARFSVDVVLGKDRLRVAIWELMPDGRRARSGQSFFLLRPPAGYDADEPLAGDPRELILGKWERTDDKGATVTASYSRTGQWQSSSTAGWKQAGKYRILDDGTLELRDVRSKLIRRARLSFTRKFMGQMVSKIEGGGKQTQPTQSYVYHRVEVGRKPGRPPRRPRPPRTGGP
jgi:hypothetical protein